MSVLKRALLSLCLVIQFTTADEKTQQCCIPVEQRLQTNTMINVCNSPGSGRYARRRIA